ncbi:AVID protein, partial [Rhodinocichla rosea]|nr:AVID protein [Rhodinocichla rosea]
SPQCDLQGQWRNELGSNMTILATNRAGTFPGSCHTAVAAASKQILVSPTEGSSSIPVPRDTPPSASLCTTTALDSTAVFVGQCFSGDDGKEVLHTSWLLREKVDSEPDDWKATR